MATESESVGAGQSRFTLDGSPALERHLQRVCTQVAEGVAAVVSPGSLEGVLLGGGYGRGEGGVLRTPTGDEPYNDLEFYVFTRGNAVLAERRYRGKLHALGHELTPTAGIEVEFKVLTFSKLRGAGPSMFYYDLLAGHRWVVGEESLLAGCEHHREAGAIPLHEATRLLMNRCSGLLFSRERLERATFGPEEADFVGRNLAKVQLALGDAWLAAGGRYHWSCRERQQRLEDAPGNPGEAEWLAAVRRHHAAGVEFKLHPVRANAGREELAARHAELSRLAREFWLALESRRLGTPFGSPRAYAESAVDKCPETSPWRNRLVNARAFGAGAAWGPRATRYPRERLLHALALLLWEPGVLADAEGRRLLQQELHTEAADFTGLVAAYEQLWQRFN